MPGIPSFATPVTVTYARQARLLTGEITGRSARTLGPSPSFDSDLARVRGADVLLFFLESYGAVSYDRPEFAAQLAAARPQFDADIRATGRDVVSAYVESPTFGGNSWLAHISFLTGIEVRDEDANVLLMAQKRDTLATAFAQHGYRSLAIMPGLQEHWPEGAFYGFGEIYGATAARLPRPAVRLVDDSGSVRDRAHGRARGGRASTRAGVRVFSDDRHAHAVQTDRPVPAGLGAHADRAAVRSRPTSSGCGTRSPTG